MSLDTTAINQRMDRFDGHHELWLFGYGSLIFKADFPFLARRRACLPGWSRRFWQGSHDHRGTPAAPGRVLTLIADPQGVCEGMAYLITPAVFAHLDHREKNGYLRLAVEIVFDDVADQGESGNDSGAAGAEALVYIATDDNAAWLGAASEADIARHVAQAHGPSGANADYVRELAAALRALDYRDAHVFAVDEALARMDVSNNIVS